MNSSKAPFIIGISGVSSSGKTTLSRLLRDILPNSFILHQDDFYWKDSKIPVKNGIQDWDCLEAIDVQKLEDCLQYIKQHGKPPPDLESKEDQNSIGDVRVDYGVFQRWREHAAARLPLSAHQGRPIAIIDGFLLYSQAMEHLWELFDVKLFLRTSYATTKRRREARSGYVTLEGFWEDPPGYVDKVVWPNYVAEHAYLFKDGDVSKDLEPKACRQLQVRTMPTFMEQDLTACLNWACEVLGEQLGLAPTV